MALDIYVDSATRAIGAQDMNEIFAVEGQEEARSYQLLEVNEIDDIISALTDLSTSLSNEATARSTTDDVLIESLTLLGQRISNLLEDPIPEISQLDGSRIEISQFFEVFTEDQIDGLVQRLSVFTNALSSKMEDITSSSDAGLTFDKTNPSIPIVLTNRPLWNEVRSKPSTFPPSTHSHAIADTTGLQSALDGKIPLTQKGAVSGVASLDVNGKVPASQIPVFDPALQIVNTIAERNALVPTGNLPVYVKDATGDPTVLTGGAFYLYELSTTTWIKLSEMESMEIIQSWENVTGKPTVFLADLNTVATGLTDTSGTMSATDSILTLFGKIKKFISDFATNVLNQSLTGLSLATGGAITASDSILVAFGKLQNQITNLTSASLPVGTVIESARSTAPTGFLDCDGSAVSRSTYADLFSAIGAVYGAGDGSTTFNLPDRRGNVGRGAGTSSGYTQNVTIAQGEKTDDAFQGHWHEFYQDSPNLYASGVSRPGQDDGSKAIAATDGIGIVRAAKTDGANGTPRTANETRVKSLGMRYFIKF